MLIFIKSLDNVDDLNSVIKIKGKLPVMAFMERKSYGKDFFDECNKTGVDVIVFSGMEKVFLFKLMYYYTYFNIYIIL